MEKMKIISRRAVLFCLLAFILQAPLRAQLKQVQRSAVYAVAFYNLENLFDTEDDPNNKGDDDFLPNGPYLWTPEKYQQKLHNIARVIGDLARDHCPSGPAFIGVSEIENARVLQDLCNTEPVRSMGLKYIHFDSPDHRGIDVGLLYNPRLFKIVRAVPYAYVKPDQPNFKTRDELVVSGILGGEPVSVIVNHWPSRYGGSKSDPMRAHAALLAKTITDSIRQADPANKVIIMGDLNDDPKDASVAKVLGAARTVKSTPEGGLFNATWPLYDRGIGTLCYQDAWNLFDQQIITDNFIHNAENTLRFWKAEVFNRNYLMIKEGKRKGYPLRSFDNSTWQNGYADHFPTVTYYIKTIPDPASTED